MTSDDRRAEATAVMRAVTISREYGSGGGEIAARLARVLTWQLIDHEIVVRVAKELRETPAEAEVHDERGEGFIGRFLTSLQFVQTAQHATVPPMFTPDAVTYFKALDRVVEGAVAEGQVVIVGRGSQFLLRERRDVLHVRIVAPLAARVTYVMRRENLDEAAARSRIETKDRDRIRFLQAACHQHPAHAELYDLVINTGVISLDDTVQLIVQTLAAKESRLELALDQLGPAAGLTPYPGRPHDLIVPPQLTEQGGKKGESGESRERSGK